MFAAKKRETGLLVLGGTDSLQLARPFVNNDPLLLIMVETKEQKKEVEGPASAQRKLTSMRSSQWW